MTPIDRETADSILRLRASKDGQVFAAYLQRALKELQGRLVEDDDQTRIRLFQGEARVLKVLETKWSSTSNTTTGSG